MSETALQAAQKAITARLTGSPDEPWGNRVRVSMARPNTPYPYVIYFWSGGGEANRIQARDAVLRFGVKCISDKMAEAMRGAERIAMLLNDSGQQDDQDDYLYGGEHWLILTITEEDVIYVPETTADTITAYHVGAFYRFEMEHT
jgi:hypothetical protein